MICKKCGAEWSDDAKFCLKCGSILGDQDEKTEEAHEAEEKPVTETTTRSETEPVPETGAEATSEASSETADKTDGKAADDAARPTVFCSKCGAKNSADSHFCEHCGAPLEEEEPAEEKNEENKDTGKNVFAQLWDIIKTGYVKPVATLEKSLKEGMLIPAILVMVICDLLFSFYTVLGARTGESLLGLAMWYYSPATIFFTTFLKVGLMYVISMFLLFAAVKMFKGKGNLRNWVIGYGNTFIITAYALVLALLFMLVHLYVVAAVLLSVASIIRMVMLYVSFGKAGKVDENLRVHSFTVGILMSIIILAILGVILFASTAMALLNQFGYPFGIQ